MKTAFRFVAVVIAALFVLCAVSGCAKQHIYTADNEILTYQKPDPDKTQITVSRTGNIDVFGLCRAFEEENPDIQVIYLDITGGNSNYKPLTEWITRGFTPDVVVSAADLIAADIVEDHFVNLSADPIISLYEAEALKRTASNDEIYFLPGPSNISAMMYNKTLFSQYGWEVPKTFDEFVALCDRITADTNGAVEPWNPNAKYDRELLTVLEAFTYEELFGGVDNRSWYNDLTSGNATFTGHMEPYVEMIDTLVSHNILREEHFSYSATTRGKEFSAGNIAMINVNIYDADNDEFDFGYMPFPTTNGTLGYLCDSYSCYVGVPIKEHTDDESAAIRRFMEFFSSEKGQYEYIGHSMKVSNVKGIKMNSADDLVDLQSAIDEGHLFEVLDFASSDGKVCNLDLYSIAHDITVRTRTPEQCIFDADASPHYSDEPVKEPPAVIATAREDMSVLETSLFIADSYRALAGAQIGLITHNEVYRGNMMRIFAGDLTSAFITVLKPRSFANDSKLVKLSMTGAQLLEALNTPVGNSEVSDSVYACSGLKCTIAPWNEPGERYVSVRLENGSKLVPDALYTVAAWDGTVDAQFITETLTAYEGTWEELMTLHLENAGVVDPDIGSRIKLVWE